MINWKVTRWIKLFGIIPIWRKTYYIYDVEVYPTIFVGQSYYVE